MAGPMTEGSSIEKSVSFLLIGLAVAAFMMLTVLGMQTYERRAEKIHEAPPSAPAPQEMIDVGN